MKLIKYALCTEINHGTEEQPDIVQELAPKSITCSDADCAVNLALARAEAHDGEITVEEVPETAEELRTQRIKLLAETDWTQVLDAPVGTETREAYRAYRQALRDIPEQAGFPEDVAWPDPPAAAKAAPDPVDTAVDTLLGGETA